MKTLFSIIAAIVTCFGAIAAGPPFLPVLRNSVTTNSYPKEFPSTGDVLVWDGVRNYWTNGTVSATVTNAINDINGNTSNHQFIVIWTAAETSNTFGIQSASGSGGASNIFHFPTADTTHSGVLSSNDWQAFSAVRSNINQTIYVDPTNGNDATAIAYRFDKPFKTITNAVGAAKYRDLVYLYPGDHLLTNSPLVLSNEISLIGAGRASTRILNSMSNNVDAANCGPAIIPGSNTYVANLTITNIFRHTNDQACYGANAFSRYNKAVTNAIVENCDMYGDFDCVFSAAFPSLHFYDFRGCRLYSRVDAVALFGLGHGMRMNNCLITIDGISQKSGLGATQRGVNDTGNTGGYFDMYNCQIDLSSASNSAATYGFDNTGGSASVPRLYNVSILSSGATTPTKLDVKGVVSLGNSYGYDTARMTANQTYLNSNAIVMGTNIIMGPLYAANKAILGTNDWVLFGDVVDEQVQTNNMTVYQNGLWLVTGVGTIITSRLNVTNNSSVTIGFIEESTNSLRINQESYIVDGTSDNQETNRYRLAYNNSGIHSNDIVRRRDYSRDIIAGANVTITATETNITIASSGGGGAGGNFNINQFSASTTFTNIKDGALFTNILFRGITELNVTPSRAAVFNSSGVLTNASGTPDGTKFLRDDNTYAVPAGGGGGGNFNVNQFDTAGSFTNIKAGALVTNINTFGLSNSTTVVTTPKALAALGAGTNLFADGTLGNNFTNGMNQTGNLIVTNMLDGQDIFISVTVSNGINASIFASGAAAPTTWFYDGNNRLATNKENFILARRQGTKTNFWILNPGFGLAAGANVTFTTNFTADPQTISIVSSGGGGAGSFGANANQFDTNNLFSLIKGALTTNLNTFGLSNRTTVVNVPQVLAALGGGTNLFADGSLGNTFTNSQNQTGNIVITNLIDGQSIFIAVHMSNGVNSSITVGGGAPPITWFPDGNSTLVTNADNWIIAERHGGITNLWVNSKGFDLAAGSNITFTTNYATGTITIASTGGGGGGNFNVNQFSASSTFTNIKDGVVLTNPVFYTTATLDPQSTSSNILFSQRGLIDGTNEWTFDRGRKSTFLKGASAIATGYTVTDGSSLNTNYFNAAGMGIQGAGIFSFSDGAFTVFQMQTNGIYPANQNSSQIGNDGEIQSTTTNWWSKGYITKLISSNQIFYPLEFAGSNGVTATAVTNNWDLNRVLFSAITNRVATNQTVQLSNVVRSAQSIATWYGNYSGGNSNQLAYTIPTAAGGAVTNITWLNWATNGTYDILLRPTYKYVVQLFADSQTNVNAWVSTDDPMVPLGIYYAGISNAVVTNLMVQAGGSTSNVSVGGVLFTDTVTHTNFNVGTATNVSPYTVAANTLTNVGDQLIAEWVGGVQIGTNTINIGYSGATTNVMTVLLTNNVGQFYKAGMAVTKLTSTTVHAVPYLQVFGANSSVLNNYTSTVAVVTTDTGTNTPILFIAQQTGGTRVNSLSNTLFKIKYESALH